MQKKWLNKDGNSTCILFFNGWGMDEHAINHLDTNGFDLCMFYNYRNFNFSEDEFTGYKKLHLISWSMGVWASAQIFKDTPMSFAKSIAINGTLSPIDARNGIQPRVFEMTLESWNDRNRKKFNLRMMGGNEKYEQLIHRLPHRRASEQKEELEFLHKEITTGERQYFKFSTVLIGRDDMVFTAKNQWNYWTAKTKVVEHNLAHYPFTGFLSWNEIVSL